MKFELIPNFGPIPEWFFLEKQLRSSQREWERTYQEGWRDNQGIPESFQHFANNHCRGVDSILDHGCGNARFLRELAKLGICHAGVQGIDSYSGSFIFALCLMNTSKK